MKHLALAGLLIGTLGIVLVARAQDSDDGPSKPALSADDAVIANNYGCADGYVFWMRDSLTPLCEPPCSTDADCGPDDGRCRLLDIADRSVAPPVLLVDEMNPDAVDYMLTHPTDPTEPPIQVCDPFYDVVGATDANAPNAPL